MGRKRINSVELDSLSHRNMNRRTRPGGSKFRGKTEEGSRLYSTFHETERHKTKGVDTLCYHGWGYPSNFPNLLNFEKNFSWWQFQRTCLVSRVVCDVITDNVFIYIHLIHSIFRVSRILRLYPKLGS